MWQRWWRWWLLLLLVLMGAVTAKDKGAQVPDKDGPAPTASVGDDVVNEVTAAAPPTMWDDQSNDPSSIDIVAEGIL